MKRAGRFAPRAALALDPRAFGMWFDLPPLPQNEQRGDVVIVSVRGPLMHHNDGGFCDSYDAIKCRVLEGLEKKPSAIVLALDSPGGLVSGCFDTTDEIRAACAEAGVKLYAYVDGQATSAAYALACAAERIVIPPTGIVGSIGVLDMLVDATAQDAMFGVSTTLIASGARKTDGNPHSATSEEAKNAARVNVDALAQVFFDHVALNRPTTPDEVRALQASIVTGRAAVPMLADEIGSLDTMIAAISAGTFGTTQGEEDAMKPNAATAKGKMTDTLAELHRMAESDDEKESARAKRMLKAYLDDDASAAADEPDGDEPAPAKKKDGEDASAAPGTAAAAPPPAPEKKDDEEAKANASNALATAIRAERNTLLNARADITPELRASLEKLPVESVKEILAATPKRTVKIGDAAASAVVGGARAEGQNDAPIAGAQHLSPEEAARLDEQMGLSDRKVGFRMEGTKQILPVYGRAAAREELAKRAKAEAAKPTG